MGEVRDETEDFLSESPEHLDKLREIIGTDEQYERWSSEDVSVDSETLATLVSRGIVTDTGSHLTLSDRREIKNIVDERRDGATKDTSILPSSIVGYRTINVVGLIGAIAFMAYLRVVSLYNFVFRNGTVILTGNDPYFYRYWVDRLANGFSSFDISALSHLPDSAANGDVLTIVTMWGATNLVGTDPRAIGTVLAWFPVITALLTALLIYMLTVRLSADSRAGILAVILLAIVPIYAVRTSLGYADHHTFDSLWLALTVLSLGELATNRVKNEPKSYRSWIATIGLGIGIAAQTLSWRGGPLFLLPIVFYIGFKSMFDIRESRSPFEANRQFVIALLLASVFTLLSHVSFGWLPIYRTVAPPLLLGCTLLVLGISEGIHRRRATRTVGTLVAGILLLMVVVWVGLSDVVGDALVYSHLVQNIQQQLFHPVDTLINFLKISRHGGAMEAYSLIGKGTNIFLRPLHAFGVVLFIAIPYMCWGSWVAYRDSRSGWLAVSIYAWYFFLLSLVQIRFAGQLALFVVPFAGVGIVHLTSGPFRHPTAFESFFGRDKERFSDSLPSWRTLLIALLLFSLIVPFGSFVTSEQMKGFRIRGDTYDTAMWMNGYDSREGVGHSHKYVFSDWNENRLYNYFMSGDSRSYTFSYQYYYPFLASKSPDEWARRLSQLNRAGFVVTEDQPYQFSDRSTQTRLHERLGSRGDGISGTDHYRLVHATKDGSTKVFEVVPGARLTKFGPPNSTVTVRTTIHVNGIDRTYKRVGRTNKYGEYGVTVPYEGTYTVNDDTQQISETAVREGNVLSTYRAHFPFDKGHGSKFIDPVGGSRGTITGANWRNGVRGSALSLQQKSDVAMTSDPALDVGNGSFSIAFWAKGDLRPSNDDPAVLLSSWDPKTESSYSFYANKNGRFCALAQDDHGRTVNNCGIKSANFHDWTLVVGVFDRKTGELRLYQNGSSQGTQNMRSLRSSIGSQRLTIGGFDDRYSARGAIDDVRVYNRSLTRREIRHLHQNLTQ